MTNATRILEWFYTNHPREVKKMMKCEHTEDLKNPNPYHMEGSVWTHTMMVYAKMAENTDSPLMLFSALLHDIGKPETRTVSGKFVSFPRHEHKGSEIVLHLGFSLAKEVAMIISCHGDFFKLSETELVEKYKRDTKLFSRVELLVKCDLAGAIATKGGVDWGMIERVKKAFYNK